MLQNRVCDLLGWYLHAAEKEKSAYARQQSAPQFRSRGSRIGLSMFANYIFPGMLVRLNISLPVIL